VPAMIGRALSVLLAAVVVAGGSLLAGSASPVSGALRQPAEAAEARPTQAISQVVTHSPPITIGFVGPARFAGVTFNRDGSRMTVHEWFGTITRVDATADMTRVVNGRRYARVLDGPLAGLWVWVDRTFSLARGQAPAPPACRYDDVLTSRRSYTRHAITLLDPIYKVGPRYVPPDLRDSGRYGINGGYRVRAIIGRDLRAMARAAREAGKPIQLVSAYRSYAQQAATFQHWVDVGGYAKALKTSARAGHSEHQLGTTLDVTSLGGAAPWTYADWAKTPAGAWMKKHAWKYGFVMTYPPRESTVTCYSYESWHYRYVGKPIASALRASGMTLREAIWAAYGP
jgi:D-alanyl-D-alanine carboxypeptidase